MILSKLVEFTESLATVPPPGYQPVMITKVIRLSKDGVFRDIISLSGDKRGKREGKVLLVPREQPQRTVGIVPRLIADNANYMLGKERGKDKPGQTEKRHIAYVQLVNECAEATGESALKAIQKWLATGGANSLRGDPRIAEDDELTIQVGMEYPTDLTTVRHFWSGRGEGKAEGVCLVTGRYGPIIDRMPIPIKGVPEGQVSGTALVSVNNPAGMSYGLDAAFNSPISTYAAEAICNGLNYLIASDKHAFRVGKVVYVCWTRDQKGFTWNLLKDPQPEDVHQLLSSIQRGHRAEGVCVKDFFVLALSANASRIVVRDHYELTLGDVKDRLCTWFKRIAIVDKDGTESKPFGLFRLAMSLFREAKDMPAHVPIALLRSALTGTPLPDYLLGLAVMRNLAMQGPYAVFNRQRYLCVERLALIKAILEEKGGIPLTALNNDHTDAAYHCGRLLALLEQIQRSALGDINATVVDRFYGAACASPGTVLGRLVNDAQAHLAKMRKGSGDGWAQNRLGEILGAIGDHFPKTLSLPRQGLFALGFYHQKAHDRAQATQNKAAKLAAQGESA